MLSPRSKRWRALRALLSAALPACAGLLAGDPPAAEAATRGLPARCAGAEMQPTAADGPAVETATLCLVDQVRAAHHLRSLRGNPQLTSAAETKLASMVRFNYFADVGPLGETALSLIASTRYPAHASNVVVGQTLAWGAGPAETTPSSIVSSWMASPPHRAVLLRRVFRDAGVAVSTSLPPVLGTAQGATYALELGRRH